MAPVGGLSSASSTSRPSLPPITTLSPSAHQASSSGDTEIFRWQDPEFDFICVECKLLPDTLQVDSALFPGCVRMLPAIVKWTPDTVWMPAEFVAFDSSRSGSEYEFQWIPGIIWPDGIAPDPLSFYRSAADWDMIEEAPRLRSDQICSVYLPISFAQVQDDGPSLDNELSYLLFLAVPSIAQLLADMDTSNPVIESHEAYFTDNLYTARKSIDWMHACSFDPTPALEAMLVEPLAALVEHPLLAQDIDAVRKIFGPGSVFLQLLAIQHSLGEAWDLNGQTFADIQTGLLLPSPPSAVRGMDAMWASADPIIVAGENQLSTAQLATFEAIFKSAHTHYFTNSSIVFYEYNWHGAAQPMELPRPHIESYSTSSLRRMRIFVT
ncbi:hypothetical protein B0H14DRAFT_2596228 [Mycena olivaceomarginata]|nr:hypothetical protein B0H14DRAFT_2596228 [Mycena olivaceomarginata]